jgi:AraC-like DNA-binding protein
MSHYVSAYYLFETDEPYLLDLERADIAQFRMILQGDAEFIFHGGRRVPVPANYFIGPRTRASHVEIRGPGRLFGFGLQPAGWAAITQLPAHEHVNSVIDATTLFADEIAALETQLRPLKTVQEMAEVINGIAPNFRQAGSAVPHWFIRKVDEWLEATLSPDIADLEAATGLSRRQTERMTRTYFGSPPKALARKYRALRTANAIAHGKGDWQDFIEDAYYDQSHCIREIKEFIGITPGAVRDHASRLTNITFDRSQLMGKIAKLSALT